MTNKHIVSGGQDSKINECPNILLRRLYIIGCLYIFYQFLKYFYFSNNFNRLKLY